VLEVWETGMTPDLASVATGTSLKRPQKTVTNVITITLGREPLTYAVLPVTINVTMGMTITRASDRDRHARNP
jgi:hypothetical protein